MNNSLTTKINRVAIIGMGALGLLYANQIDSVCGEGTVDFLLDDERYERYQSKQFIIQDEEKKFSMVKASEAEAYDLVMVAVKYNSLISAIDSLEKAIGPNTIIMSVMNGITSENIIGERFGRDNLIYTVAQGMDAMHFGDTLRYTKMGELYIGLDRDGKQENLDSVHEFFDAVKMPHVVENNILRRMWSKFMLNVGINQTCMMYECTYSQALAPGEANDTLIGAMKEVIDLSVAEGINLTTEDMDFYINILKTLDPDGVPSMRQDGIAKRASEVDMFAGTVIELAKKHGMDVPVNSRILSTVKEIESNYR